MKIHKKTVRLHFLAVLTMVIVLTSIFAACDKVGAQDSNEISISFNSMGGSSVQSITIEKGKPISLPAAPTKEGYVFDGWYYDENYSTAYKALDTFTSNTTLYAKWNENKKQFTNIVFNDQTFSYDGTPHSLSISGCPEGADVSFDIPNSQTLVGVYKITATLSKVGYETKTYSATMTIDKGIIDTSKFVFEDKEFQQDGTPKSLELIGDLPYGVTVEYINNNQTLDGVYTVTAHFVYDNNLYYEVSDMTATMTIVTPLVSYNIHYELNKGVNSGKNPSTYLSPNEKEIKLYPATRSAWIFDGWYRNENFEGSAITELPKNTSGDIYLYAKWVKPYIIAADDLFTINDKTITATIGHDVSIYSFIESFNACSDCTWSLYSDYLGTSELVLKNMQLNYGMNTAYIVVWSEDRSAFTQYTLNVYRLSMRNYSYSILGRTVDAGQIEEQSALNAPDDPDVQHYIFEGWYVGDQQISFPYTVHVDTVITAKMTPIEYDLTYVLNGGTNDDSNPTTYNVENISTLMSRLQKATKDYHDFIQWSLSLEDIAKIESGELGSLTLNADFTPTVYNLIFHKDGGNYASEYKKWKSLFIDGNMAQWENCYEEWLTEKGLSAVLEKMKECNLTFSDIELAWQLVESGKEIDEVVWQPLSEEETRNAWASRVFSVVYSEFYATTPCEPEVFVLYYEFFGLCESPDAYETTYTVESDDVLFESIHKNGYRFVGWYNNAEFNGDPITVIPAGSHGNVELYAKWEQVTFNFVYELDGGVNDAANPLTFTIDTFIDAITNLRSSSKDYYNFKSWTCGPEDSVVEAWEADGKASLCTYSDNYYLIAEYTPIDYSITFNLGGGKFAETPVSKYNIETADLTLSIPSRTGYTFVGWTGTGLDARTMTVVIPTGSYGNRTYTANWEANDYTVSFNANGGTVSESSKIVTYDASYTLPTPIRTGYTFAGWYSGETKYSAGMWRTASNVSLTAKWTANTNTAYKVNHYQQNIEDDNYTLYATQNLNGISDSSVTPSVNTYTGFTSPATQTVTINSDGSRVVNYYYTRNYYTVTVVGNGGTNNTISQKYQSAIDTSNWSTRTGHTLGGLYADISLSIPYTDTTMPAQNKTVYAYWTGETVAADFTYTSATSGITITGYLGSSTVVKIPEQIGGVKVITIAASAFANNTNIRSINIPDTVENIAGGVFNGCSSLESMTIPFVGAKAGVTSIDTYQYPFGYIFGTSSYTGGAATKQYYYGSSTSSTTSNTYYIPSSLKSVTVTGGNILYGAFYNCSGLTSVTIPDSVTSIGSSAFSDCSSLTSVTIPDSVTYIGPSAFSDCSSLTSIKIPDSVTSIGDSAFYGCSGLTNVTIPESVTSIGSSAFYNCSGLTSVTIPDSVTHIGSSAFSDCSSLTSITIPDSVKDIGFSAFYNCSGLTSITIPDSVTSIGDSVFYGCSGLTNVTIPESVMSIGSSAFSDCSSLTSITIPDSVTSIGSSAFYNCSGLTSVTIPDSVTYIDRYAFRGCSSLTNITIPDSVKGIDYCAFAVCSGLTSITIPDSVTWIHDDAFYGCKKLTNIYYTGDIVDWCKGIMGLNNIMSSSRTLYICGNKVEGELVIPEGVTSIPSYAFYYCTGLTSITIPDSVTSISKYAFYNCSSLTSITIPDSVTSIGSEAFRDCSGLTSIYYTGDIVDWCKGIRGLNNIMSSSRTLYICGNKVEGELVIPEGVTSIPSYAFYYCTSLTSITIPDSVTSIGDGAFYRCSGLTSITIPDSVTSIGDSAFYGCSGLTNVTIPESVASIGSSAFYNCSGLTSVTIPDSVTSISKYAFYNCSSLTSITIPDSVTSIGDGAFYRCSGLTSVTIPDSVTSIGSEVFYNCSGLTSITIPDSVTSIGSEAFYNCSGLTSVTIPDSVTTIGSSAFSDCSSLTSITIPDSVTSIGSSAFYNCSGLTSVTIPDSVTSIGFGAFNDCSGLTSVTIGNSVTSIGDHAFQFCRSLTSINFNGTITQWDAISKGYGWNYYVPATQVICTDGTVSI